MIHLYFIYKSKCNLVYIVFLLCKDTYVHCDSIITRSSGFMGKTRVITDCVIYMYN